ncbi:MAG: stage III sporulation protein AC [Clostridiales bacterium]|nr:stage III sporulation protein AC [Clostridiales bacterium]MBQ2817568.1 stage III sporulation protein AC [Clostridia bacterium]MBQ4637982.1 stage III sporulation protein AC [Clostridia bacterium]
MNVDMIFKLAAIGVLTAVASRVLESAGRDDIAGVIAMVGLSVALIMALGIIGDLFTGLKKVFSI